ARGTPRPSRPVRRTPAGPDAPRCRPRPGPGRGEHTAPHTGGAWGHPIWPALAPTTVGGTLMATTGIAQRNIELARKGYRAFNDKDVEAVMSLFAEDILWHGGPRGPLAGDHKGKAAVMDLFMKFGQLTEGSYTAELHDVLATEEHTVVLGISTMSRKG